MGRVEHRTKWNHRHALVAATVLGLVAGVVVSGFFAFTANREATAAREAERQARNERAQAEEALRRAEWRVYGSQLLLAQSAFAEGNEPLAMQYLDECQWDLRGWEHRHLWARFNSEQTFLGHTDDVASVAFSPDGTRIASGSNDRTVKVWDAESGKQLLELKGHTHNVSSVAFSPDGTRLASGGGDERVMVWDVERGQQLLALERHPHGVGSLAFSPDGKRLFAWDSDGGVRAWSVKDGESVEPVDPPPMPPLGPATSPDGLLRAEPREKAVAILDTRIPAHDVWPLPDRDQRTRYHSEQAARAAKDKQWFAAAFHLGRLLLDHPDDAELQRRRDGALTNHAAELPPPPPAK